MTILGIETSCDETSAAVVEKNKNELNLLSNTVSSSVKLHAKSGGIIPEIAAREQIKFIIPVIKEALEKSSLTISELDAIAVTYGPGLLGSLLVGVETAKSLSFVFNKPLIPTNHLIGHIYANWVDKYTDIQFPAIGLIVSGGHTDLILIKKHGNIKWLGGTRDDAAGEALDKTGRLMGFSYPAGPAIEKAAISGNAKTFDLPRPMIGSDNFDFSFSGLKTAVIREIADNKLDQKVINDLCASIQQAIVDVLVIKTLNAAKKFNVKSILLGGGVTANQKLRDKLNLSLTTSNLPFKLFVPPKSLCTDNGAMIAAAAFYNGNRVNFEKIKTNPQLYF